MIRSLKRHSQSLNSFDWYLFLGVLLLVSFGFVALYSFELSQAGTDFATFKRQLVSAAIGIAAMFVVGLSDYRQLLASSKYAYIFAVVLLLAVLFLGVTLRGTRGWLALGGVNFQVVEIVKLILLLFLASFFARFGRELRSLRYVFLSGLFTLVLFALVLLQPDLGSALVLFFLWAGYLLLVGTKGRNLLLIIALLAVVSGILWATVLQDYQKQRVLTFLHPTSDPLGEGYSINQARIAVGSGGLYGRGVGLGTQSQLRFLPAAHTDFIIAVIAEELGFLGSVTILVFFAFVFYRILRIAKEAPDDVSALLLLGVVILLASQMFINVGVNLGLMPVTGIALPFVSYGGSSLVVSFMLIGLVQSVAAHKH